MWNDIVADSELITGDEMDLTKKLYPLTYYLRDRDELLDQLFATVKGSLFNAIMPSTLKAKYPINER
jgi:hypothetical protein